MAVVEPGSNVETIDQRQAELRSMALAKLEELGGSMRPSPDAPYDKNAQIRAYQMMAEGRLGGPGRGQGRKRKPRASELLAEKIRKKVDKMEGAIDAALESDNEKIALDAVRLAVKLEHDEASLQLAEEKQDAELAKMSKEDLVASLISLAGDPSIEASVGGIIDLPASEVKEITEAEVINGDSGTSSEDSTTPSRAWPNGRGNRENGRGSVASDRGSSSNPFTEAAKRRAAN